MPKKAKKEKAKVYRARYLVADALLAQGAEHVFGIVGYPIQALGEAIQQAGIKLYGMHNEQAASYAAGAVGYLTGRPDAYLTVIGPGVIHAVAGMANSKVNCWPMICLSGASEASQDGMGFFQEARQLQYVDEACKWAHRVDSAMNIPRYIQQAVRHAINGQPGATYIDLPANTLRERVDKETIVHPPRARGHLKMATLARPYLVQEAVDLLRSAKNPLMIIGKGGAFAEATPELERFVDMTNIPSLPTPMAKGTLPDDHPNFIMPARSAALKGAGPML